MADIVSTKKRSEMMSGIRGKDTKPELAVRKGLYAKGFRYRLYYKRLPGKPDIVLPKYHVVVFIHGCFWHGHDCHLFKWPSSRPEFWKTKISRNKEKDSEVMVELGKLGWRVLTIWECSLKGKDRRPLDEVIEKTSDWILKGPAKSQIRGIAC